MTCLHHSRHSDSRHSDLASATLHSRRHTLAPFSRLNFLKFLENLSFAPLYREKYKEHGAKAKLHGVVSNKLKGCKVGPHMQLQADAH